MLYSMVLLSFTIFGLTSASPLSAATCLPLGGEQRLVIYPQFHDNRRLVSVLVPGNWGYQTRTALLGASFGAGDVELADGPPEAQKWKIACATCPSNGLATDCTFENFRFPNVPGTDICILTQGIPELGNDALVGDCKTGLDGAVGISIQINYNL
ncbi:hypothetical protein DFH09DRAFT_1095068 [Mycena vulgaris]|nr:hypothetical protein DFH09DRAFT_1095068 [Mycena vulgaris]